MTLSKLQLLELLELAKNTASEAGLFVNSFLQKELQVSHKVNASSLCTAVLTQVDLQAEQFIMQQLNESMKQYSIGLLSEEQKDDHSRLKQDFFWCIDPIDGTLAFTKKQAGFCVSIALVSQEGEAILAAVYDAFHQDLYYAGHNLGAFKNGQPIKQKILKKNTLHHISDPSFAQFNYCSKIESNLKSWAAQSGMDYQSQFQGGSVMNALWVLQSPVACFFKFPKSSDGGGCSWDFAASCCIARELGYPITDIYGAPLQLNRAESVFMNHNGVIVSTNRLLSEHIKQIYAKLMP